MYSIFGTKSRSRSYLQEGEPPPKKLVSEEDLLIKKLSKNQLNTKTSLTEQLQHQKSFLADKDSVTDITGHFKGHSTLEEFQLNAATVHQENRYRSLGLSDREIQILKDRSQLPEGDFRLKYCDINDEALEKCLERIGDVVKRSDVPATATSSNILDNHPKRNPHFLEAPSLLPTLEKQFSSNLDEYSKVRKKHIRRKARSLGQCINQLNSEGAHSIGPRLKPEEPALNRKSLWDVVVPSAGGSERVVGCEPQKLFTVKNGRIVELSDCSRVDKLSVEEIRRIPKFADYNAGVPSRTLFVKNLRRGLKEEFLQGILLKNFPVRCFSIKVMSGKMKGQAFIEFADETAAAKGLHLLNGTLQGDRPVIVQFSKSSL